MIQSTTDIIPIDYCLTVNCNLFPLNLNVITKHIGNYPVVRESDRFSGVGIFVDQLFRPLVHI